MSSAARAWSPASQASCPNPTVAWTVSSSLPAASASVRLSASHRRVFDLTCALAAYPPVPEFADLQRRLSRALDREAGDLAARPVPGERVPGERVPGERFPAFV